MNYFRHWNLEYMCTKHLRFNYKIPQASFIFNHSVNHLGLLPVFLEHGTLKTLLSLMSFFFCLKLVMTCLTVMTYLTENPHSFTFCTALFH
jgi:hypothetical protein